VVERQSHCSHGEEKRFIIEATQVRMAITFEVGYGTSKEDALQKAWVAESYPCGKRAMLWDCLEFIKQFPAGWLLPRAEAKDACAGGVWLCRLSLSDSF
jgi:hypothetical protein